VRERVLAEGYSVVGRRVRTPHGEVDLVVARGAELVCIEVKTSVGRPALGYFRPGNRFRVHSLRRQLAAARDVGRALGRRESAEVSLFEVWIDPRERSASGRWHRDLRRPLDLPR
jgi:hypothetical protein